jgi:hypothetical protein
MSSEPTVVQLRLERLRQMRAARDGRSGYKTNVMAIDEEIARLQAKEASDAARDSNG